MFTLLKQQQHYSITPTLPPNTACPSQPPRREGSWWRAMLTASATGLSEHVNMLYAGSYMHCSVQNEVVCAEEAESRCGGEGR